jgi:hypothetical protein
MSCELSVAYKVFDITFEIRLETDIFIVPLYTDNTGSFVAVFKCSHEVWFCLFLHYMMYAFEFIEVNEGTDNYRVAEIVILLLKNL